MTTQQTPASIAQRLLWMIKHYRGDFGALSCPVLCRITGPLDVAALRVAVTLLAARHESLRTTFTGRGARLAQVVHEPSDLPVTLVDLTGAADPRGAADTAARAEIRTPIDPTQWPARATLWRVAADEHVFCLNLHHLVTDAWSTGILFRDLGALYTRATGGAADLPAPGWQYRDFVAWQQRLLDGDELRRHRDYWRRQLAGAQLPALTGGGPDEPGDLPGTATVHLDLDQEAVARLRELARSRHTTLFTVLLAVFYAHLHHTTGQRDLAVASMFANRSRSELREAVGLLANMVLLRARLTHAGTFADLVDQAHAAAIGAFTYQDLPYQMLPIDALDTGGRRADDVLFNVMTEVQHRMPAGAARFELLVPDDLGGRFRFELAIAPVGTQDLRAVLFYRTDDFDADAAHAFLSGYATLAATLARDPGHQVADTARL